MLDEFKPDICLVQEALTASEAMSRWGSNLFWSDPCGSDSGVAVWVRRGLTGQPLLVRSKGSYVAGVVCTCGRPERAFLSVFDTPQGLGRFAHRSSRNHDAAG
jgi:hypothetical protein